MITDGSCGMREFKSWVLSTMVTKDPYESALSYDHLFRFSGSR